MVCLSRYPTTGGSPFSTAALQPAASVSPGTGHHVVAGCTIVPDPDNDPELTTAKKGRTIYCNCLANSVRNVGGFGEIRCLYVEWVSLVAIITIIYLMKDVSATVYNVIKYYRIVIKDDMFRPSCGHHQVYIKDTETYEELRTYMGSQWCYICIK